MTSPDVRIRLSAEGTQDIIDAFRKVQNETKKTADSTKDLAGNFTITKAAIASFAVDGIEKALHGIKSFGEEIINSVSQVKKLMVATGATSKEMSVLQAVANETGTPFENLEKGVVKFSKALHGLNLGESGSVAAFKQLGLSVKDFNGLNFAESLSKTAEKMAEYKGGADKIAVSTEIFGKNALSLQKFLSTLGTEGFEELGKKAESMGLILSDDLITSVSSAKKSMREFNETLKGMVNTVLSGMAPYLAASSEGIKDLFGSTNLSLLKTFGEYAGRVFNGVFFAGLGIINDCVAGFKQLFNIGSGIIDYFTSHTSFKDVMARIKSESDKIEADRLNALGKLELDLNVPANSKASKQKKEIDTSEVSKKIKEKKVKEDHSARDAYDFQQKLEQARIKAQQDSLPNEIAVLKANNSLREAELDNEYKNGKIKYQEYYAERQKIVESENKAEVNAIQEKIKVLKDSINIFGPLTQDQMLEKIKIQAEIAKLESEIEVKSIELKKKQAEIKQDELEEQKRLKAQEDLIYSQLKDGARNSLQNSLTNFFESGIHGAKSFSDAFRGMAISVIQSINQIVSAALAAQIVKGIFNIGVNAASGGSSATMSGDAFAGSVYAATGGYITGPGTGTSDSIPAMLSNGEFVIRSAVVSQPGMLEALHNINRGFARPNFTSGIRRFAEGGLVSNVPSMSNSGSSTMDSQLTVSLDSGLILKELKSPKGQKLIVETLSNNKNSVSRALGL